YPLSVSSLLELSFSSLTATSRPCRAALDHRREACQALNKLPRHSERRLAVNGPPLRSELALERSEGMTLLESGPGCHPERSEGSVRPSSQILRCAQSLP